MALTPTQRQKLLEKFLTNTNNKLAALSELVAAGVEFDAQVVLGNYTKAVLKVIDQLEVDSGGRLIASTRNAELLEQVRLLNEGLRATPEYIGLRAAERTKRLIVGVSRWMGEATKAATVLGEIGQLGDVMRESLTKMVTSATPERFASGTERLMYEVSQGVSDSIVEGVRQFATTKERLQAVLFSDEPAKALQERADMFRERAERGAANLNRDITRIEQGIADVEQARDKIAEQLKEYKAARKEYLETRPNQGQVLRQSDSLGASAAKDARKRIMDDQQNELIKAARERYGADGDDVVYVNAKNTDYDDNCFDAAEEEPMTLEQWEASEFGPPRSSKRDCGQNCKCLLIAVGTKRESVVASGDQISEF